MLVPKKYAFNYHYNKPASLLAGRNRLTVHHRNVCHIVDVVQCHVPTGSVDRKIQPRCVIAGKCTTLTITTNPDGLTVAVIA